MGGGEEFFELWASGEVGESRGFAALGLGGNPAELLRKTKETLVAA